MEATLDIMNHPTPAEVSELPHPKPSNLTKAAIEQVANHVRRSLGYQPGDDLQPLIEEKLGGTVEFIDLSVWLDDKTDMIEVYPDGSFHVFLSRVGGLLRNRFTLAHELGHFILHSKAGREPMRAARSEKDERVEWEANWFAAEFLMPKERFREEMAKQRSVTDLASLFLVSPSAIRVRKKVLEESI